MTTTYGFCPNHSCNMPVQTTALNFCGTICPRCATDLTGIRPLTGDTARRLASLDPSVPHVKCSLCGYPGVALNGPNANGTESSHWCTVCSAMVEILYMRPLQRQWHREEMLQRELRALRRLDSEAP